LKLAKWGNSLAIRIPAEVADKLGLRENEEADVRVTGEHSFEVVRNRRRQDAIETIRRLRVTVPEDFTFNRDEIYDR
jgi:antitoxin MazE